MAAMLHVRATRIFSEHYEISDGGQVLTTVSNRWLREAGSFRIAGERYSVGRRSRMGGDFFAEHSSRPPARAEKPSAFLRRFVVTVDGESHELAARSAFRRGFALRREGREVGSVEPTSLFSRSARVDLPHPLSLPVQVFLTWMVLVLWKRQRNSS